jgi:hypothetical protein
VSAPVKYFAAPGPKVARGQLEAAIEEMIALLDALDGDCDLEDDHEGYDPLDRGEFDYERGVDLPRYGVDQSAGPVNVDEAIDAYRRRFEEV